MTDILTVPAHDWTFNLLPDALAQLGVPAHGVIHVGAHWGEEVPVYLQCGFDPVVLVEPDPESGERITRQDWFDNHRVVLHRTACAGLGGEATFFRTKDGRFSGLTARSRQVVTDKFTVRTVPLSEIQQNHPVNVLVVDTQGTELEVLGSAYFSTLDLIIVETQVIGRHLYGAYEPDLIHLTEHRGWELAIKWDREPGWSDMLLVPRRSRG